jgi:hypothetical protein
MQEARVKIGKEWMDAKRVNKKSPWMLTSEEEQTARNGLGRWHIKPRNWREATPDECREIEEKIYQDKLYYLGNHTFACVAYELAKEGDLIGAVNTIATALEDGLKIGPRTETAVGNILVMEGFVKGEVMCFEHHDYYHPESTKMFRFAERGEIALAVQCLFTDEKGNCKLFWQRSDRVLFNERKWQLFDILQKNGGRLKRTNPHPMVFDESYDLRYGYHQ